MDCSTSTLEQLKTVPSRLQDETVSHVSPVRSTSNDFVREADFLLDQLTGINDTAVDYLCRAPTVGNWYYDLSSQKSPLAEHRVDNTEEAFMLREISQKIRNYQDNSEPIIGEKKYGNQNETTLKTPVETQKLHRSPQLQPQEAIVNHSSNKFTTICPTPNSSTMSIHPAPVSTIRPTPMSTTTSIHSTPVSIVRSTRLSTIRSTVRPTRLSTTRPTPLSTVRPTRLSTIRPTPLSTSLQTPVSSIRPTPVSTIRQTLVATSRPTPLSTIRPTPVSTIRQTLVATSRPTPLSTIRPTPVSTFRPIAVPTDSVTPVSTVRPTPVSNIRPSSVSTVRPTPVSTVRPTPVSSIRPTPVSNIHPTPVSNICSVKTKDQIISNNQRGSTSHNPHDIFLEIEDEIWDLSKIRHCENNPDESEQEEAMDLSTVQYNDVLNARYEMITPPFEEITETCKTSSIYGQYETVSPPAQEVPQSPRLGRHFATASPCFYETQSKTFPLHHISGSKKYTYRSLNPKPHAANFPQRYLDNHFVKQNRTLGFPYYSYHHIPWIL